MCFSCYYQSYISKVSHTGKKRVGKRMHGISLSMHGLVSPLSAPWISGAVLRPHLTHSWELGNVHYISGTAPNRGLVQGLFLVVFAANEVSGLSDFLSFLKNFAWVFQKSLSFSEKMQVFRRKCEFFEENAWFLLFLGRTFRFLECLQKNPWVWVFFSLSFFQND